MKAKNFFRAVLYVLVPALGRRYQMRNKAWKNHAEKMQSLLDCTRSERIYYDSRNKSKLYCVEYDCRIPAYPEICR